MHFGFDVVEQAIKDCKEYKLKVPHEIMDLRGSLKGENAKNIIDTILAAKDYDAMKAIYKSIGVEKVEDAILECKAHKIEVPHVIMDVRGSVVIEFAEEIINTILEGKDYDAMVDIYKAIGIERVEQAIKICEASKIKVPHVIMDVRGPLVANNVGETV